MIYDFEGDEIFSLCEGITPEKKKWRTIGKFCNVSNNGCTAPGTENPLIIKALYEKVRRSRIRHGLCCQEGGRQERGVQKMNGNKQGGRDMRTRSTSLLALLLTFAFVAVGITTAAAKNCDLMAAAQEMEQGKTETQGMVEDQKVEVKGKVEEEKGKTTLEMKKTKPEGTPEKAPAAPEIPE
jgi:hypothetical protein